MQLDRTRIAIRARSVWDVLDLALIVLRHSVGRILAVGLWFVLPVALLDIYCLHDLIVDEQSNEFASIYIWMMLEIIYLQAPLVTAPITLMLGRMMFLQTLDTRTIFRELRQMALPVLWSQGILRGGLVGTFLLMGMASEQYEFTGYSVLFSMLFFAQWVIRGIRPFLNEIILLERTPFRARDRQVATTSRRNRTLHGPSGGDLLSRSIVISVTCVVLTLSLSLSLWFLASVFTSQWQWNSLILEGLVPAAMWTVCLYATVVRFLNYLDLRIRREGWEVELAVRAAAEELRGEMA